MIQSMTGYGKAAVEGPDKRINVEIKSLNSKALDLSARIAPLYREKEMEIRAEIARTLERGKVDFCLWIEKKEGATPATPIDPALVQAYYQRIKEISAATGIPEPADWFGTLLRLPDVLAKNEVQELSDEEWALAHEAVQRALDALVEFRRQEGIALEKKFREKIANISRLLTEVEPYEQERVGRIKERIVEALQKTLEVDYDKNRLEQELIYYIEKLDINEEKQRLANHLKYFIQTLEEGHGQGKKLGFIAQEMGREINTLGSKSNQAEMQRIVVRMKDELEQIKEQVLNVM
ncbi:YicC family protein [Bacteroides sp. ET71]|uniref:YicC/YloC family endoribonuclease n=1 Tax=Bacteroides sp. ET71 TaxID=2939421 RepID=UPI002011093B|nr:YicC/YloC family endoribonuclease [Bacteroides sp. ET71]MCL1614996.1 YicC family protein [Bacteroides sp. ET71]